MVKIIKNNNLFICGGLFMLIVSYPHIQQHSRLGNYYDKSAVLSASIGAVLIVLGILRKIDERKR